MSETPRLIQSQQGRGTITVLDGIQYTASNPTIDTGIAMAIQTTFVETNAVLAIYNGYPAGGPIIMPDYHRLIARVAGASTTSAEFAIAIDNGNRVSSGGTVLANGRTRTGLLTALGAPSKAVVTFGNITTTAPTANRVIRVHGTLKVQAAPCWVVGDEVHFAYGLMEQGLGLLSGAAVARYVMPVGQVGIDPGDTMLLHIWNVANATTAPSWETDVSWFENPPNV
jgi:hypothetical protein